MQGKSEVMFSKEVKIASRTINGWMRKEFLPRTEHLIRLASHFCVSIDYLLGLEN